MLFLGDLMLAFVVGLLLTGVFAAIFTDFRTWDALIVFFLAIFLFSWVGGVWATPFGPVLFDYYVYPFIIGGLLIALLMAAWFTALRPPTLDERPTDIQERRYLDGSQTLLAALGAIFWVYIIVMVVVILVSYF